MAGRCDVEGVFRKDEDLVEMEGDSTDGNTPERWTECRFCCSTSDLERYFGGIRRPIAKSGDVLASKVRSLSADLEKARLERDQAIAKVSDKAWSREKLFADTVLKLEAAEAELEKVKGERDALKRRFDKFKTVGCSCGKDDVDPGDCYGCRGLMNGFLDGELEAALAALRSSPPPAIEAEKESCRHCLGTGRITWIAGGVATNDPCANCVPPATAGEKDHG